MLCLCLSLFLFHGTSWDTHFTVALTIQPFKRTWGRKREFNAHIFSGKRTEWTFWPMNQNNSTFFIQCRKTLLKTCHCIINRDNRTLLFLLLFLLHVFLHSMASLPGMKTHQKAVYRLPSSIYIGWFSSTAHIQLVRFGYCRADDSIKSKTVRKYINKKKRGKRSTQSSRSTWVMTFLAA